MAPLRQVAVCGLWECSRQEAEWARAVGGLLAQAGVTVLCGGGSGVMAAVADGAACAGGLVIGVRGDTDRSTICPGLSAVLFTNMAEARNAILVESADAVIVVGGSWGTLSEIALARRRGGIPVVSLGGWEIRNAHGQSVAAMASAVDPADAVRQALGGIGKDAGRAEPEI
ncbi:LOG family protein [Nocardia sp. NPDC051787]|uniref:SLOG cluster 4 domain-containing protein n=1 Tax=Nocardia sp. NPDC051787 TaxID=3155415 RepID=UPI0034230C98